VWYLGKNRLVSSKIDGKMGQNRLLMGQIKIGRKDEEACCHWFSTGRNAVNAKTPAITGAFELLCLMY